MIGLGAAKSSKEFFSTVINGIVVGEGNLYASIDLLAKERSVFPRFKKIYHGVTVGALEQVTMPDLILFPVNSHQMCVVSTAFAFDTGEIINGFAGSAACVMTIPVPLMENKPVFSVGDHGGRTHMRLKDDEFLLGFPYRLVPGLIKNIDRTVFANE
jgi:uncharacterized protein (DUF169 family)